MRVFRPGATTVVALSLLVAAFGPSRAAEADIVFETDFSADVGYRTGAVRNWHQAPDGSEVAPPTGFGGVRVSDGGSLQVVPSGDGSQALRVGYGPSSATGRSSLSLGVHLTGAKGRGFRELYVRYNIKLPPRFKAGSDGQRLPFWKWGRLWQNTDPSYDGNWTENRADSGFVVWGVYPGFRGNKNFAAAFADTQSPVGNLALGSNGGPFQEASWRLDGAEPTLDAHFQGVGNGAWALDPSRPGYLLDPNQGYHTLEWRFRLASGPGAEDGIYQMWIDGVEQMPYTDLAPAYGAPQRGGISTLAVPGNSGGGFDHLTVFDNMQNWADDFARSDVDGFFLLNDVVVSTERIGHGYRARAPGAGGQCLVRSS